MKLSALHYGIKYFKPCALVDSGKQYVIHAYRNSHNVQYDSMHTTYFH